MWTAECHCRGQRSERRDGRGAWGGPRSLDLLEDKEQRLARWRSVPKGVALALLSVPQDGAVGGDCSILCPLESSRPEFLVPDTHLLALCLGESPPCLSLRGSLWKWVHWAAYLRGSSQGHMGGPAAQGAHSPAQETGAGPAVVCHPNVSPSVGTKRLMCPSPHSQGSSWAFFLNQATC